MRLGIDLDLNPIDKIYAQADRPMILITQIQRSGGTMTSQLFDGHPEIFPHPHELFIGKPKWDWPSLDINSPSDIWFEKLYEYRFQKLIEKKQFVKAGSNPEAMREWHPFNFNPNHQKHVFDKMVYLTNPSSQREVLNCFFTSFFHAWKEYNFTGKEKFISAFCPRILMFGDSIERFMNDYPDGKIICVLRDPRSWYISSSRHDQKLYGNIRIAIDQWKESAEKIDYYSNKFSKMFKIITYEEITKDVKTTMKKVTDWLHISYHSILEIPTYAGRSKLPNSSFSIGKTGVQDTFNDRLSLLSKEELTYIENFALPTYQKILKNIKLVS